MDVRNEEIYERLSKPLKELAQNWEINISDELEEYVNILSDLMDTQSKDLNYAQIAMIVYGSTNVYARKVDYLQDLAYKFLNDLFEGNISLDKTGKTYNKRKKTKAVEQFEETVNQFLKLDDVIEIQKTQLTNQQVNDDEDVIKDGFPVEYQQSNTDFSNNLDILQYKTHRCGAFEIGDLKSLVRRDTYENKTVSGHEVMPEIYNIVHSQSNVIDFNITSSQREELLENDGFSQFDFDAGSEHDIEDELIPEEIPISISFDDQNSRNKIVKDQLMFTRLYDGLLNCSNYKPKNKLPFRKQKTKRRKCRKRTVSDKDEKDYEEKLYFPNQTRSVYSIGQTLKTERAVKNFENKLKKKDVFLFENIRLKSMFLDKKKIEKKHNVIDLLDEEDEDNISDIESEIDEEDELDIQPKDKETIERRRTLSFGENTSDIDEDKNDLDEDDFEETMPMSYVDLVKKHVKKYLERASIWAKESQVDLVVRAWQTKLNPILIEQNSHPDFDIHVYGSKVLSCFETTPKMKDSFTDFESVVSKRTNQKYETCRLFLATLQLANNGNVKLNHESNYSKLNIKVLDTVLADEKMKGSFV